MKPNAYELAYNSKELAVLKTGSATYWDNELTFKLLVSRSGSPSAVVEETSNYGKLCYLLEELILMDKPPVPKYVVNLMSDLWESYRKFKEDDIPF